MESIAEPGKHFVALEPRAGDKYFLFPPNKVGVADTHHVREADMEHFRNSWVLERKQRPDVVVIEWLAMPARRQTKEYNSKYCSLFFRPWTLFIGSVDVPHISVLALPRAPLQRLYEESFHSFGEATSEASNPVKDSMEWAVAWSEYVRGNVVSETAAELIRNFLLNTMFSGSERVEDADDERIPTLYSNDVPRLQLSTETFQKDLLGLRSCGENFTEAAKVIAKSRKKAAKHDFATSYDRSKMVCEGLWKVVPNAVAAEDRKHPGEMYEDTFDDHLHALTSTESTAKNSFRPLQEATTPSVEFRPGAGVHGGLAAVLASIERGQKNEDGVIVKPNQEQTAFLRHFTQRLQVELGEKRAERINETNAEPLLDCVLGPPGTGPYTSKSR